MIQKGNTYLFSGVEEDWVDPGFGDCFTCWLFKADRTPEGIV